jgi:hypothetical protein
MEFIRMCDPRSESKSLLPAPKHQRATNEISSISGIRESARQSPLNINYNR